MWYVSRSFHLSPTSTAHEFQRRKRCSRRRFLCTLALSRLRSVLCLTPPSVYAVHIRYVTIRTRRCQSRSFGSFFKTVSSHAGSLNKARQVEPFSQDRLVVSFLLTVSTRHAIFLVHDSRRRYGRIYLPRLPRRGG